MESRQALKSRSRAVKNVGQITKAMEVVAATKMRKAQEVAFRSRPYAFGALELLERLSRVSTFSTPLAESRKVEHSLLVIIASDKGLTGAFNTQVFRLADRVLNDPHITNPLVLAVGKKSTKYAAKKNLKIIEKFSGFGDYALPEEIRPLSEIIIAGFLRGEWNQVLTISTHFRTALRQETLARQILPIDFDKIRETVTEIVPERGKFAGERDMSRGTLLREIDYLFEPSAKEVYESLIPHLVNMQIYHLILEANASEHSARRVAMKTASDNAEELLADLTLAYNKARQASITKEIIEITSTQTALS